MSLETESQLMCTKTSFHELGAVAGPVKFRWRLCSRQGPCIFAFKMEFNEHAMYMRKFKVRKNAHFKKLIIIIRIATCDKFRAVLLTNKRSHSNILRAHVSIFRQKYANALQRMTQYSQ